MNLIRCKICFELKHYFGHCSHCDEFKNKICQCGSSGHQHSFKKGTRTKREIDICLDTNPICLLFVPREEHKQEHCPTCDDQTYGKINSNFIFTNKEGIKFCLRCRNPVDQKYILAEKEIEEKRLTYAR